MPVPTRNDVEERVFSSLRSRAPDAAQRLFDGALQSRGPRCDGSCGSWVPDLRFACPGHETEHAASPYEKNAIFSAWVMRRIGAMGSFAAARGFCKMPLARM